MATKEKVIGTPSNSEERAKALKLAIEKSKKILGKALL